MVGTGIGAEDVGAVSLVPTEASTTTSALALASAVGDDVDVTAGPLAQASSSVGVENVAAVSLGFTKSSSVAAAIVLALSSAGDAGGVRIAWAVFASMDGFSTGSSEEFVAASCSAVIEDDIVVAVSVVAATSSVVVEDDGVAAVSVVVVTSSAVNDAVPAEAASAAFTVPFSSATIAEGAAVATITLELEVASSFLAEIGFLTEVETCSCSTLDDTVAVGVVSLEPESVAESDTTSVFFEGFATVAFRDGVDTVVVVVVPVPEECDWVMSSNIESKYWERELKLFVSVRRILPTSGQKAQDQRNEDTKNAPEYWTAFSECAA
jgi:hypothetical protein